MGLNHNHRLTDTRSHLGNIDRGKVSTLITIIRTKSGNCVAFDGYNDKPVGRAGGGGYDKRNTALCQAIEKIVGIKLDVNGASGERAVCEEAKRNGIIIEGLNGYGSFELCA